MLSVFIPQGLRASPGGLFAQVWTELCHVGRGIHVHLYQTSVIQDGAECGQRKGKGHRLRTRGAGSPCVGISQCTTPRNPKTLSENLT